MWHKRTFAGSIALLTLIGCSSWRPVEPTPAQFADQHPRDIRVLRSDSSRVTLRSSALHDDTLVGHVGDGLARNDTMQVIRIPLGDVRGVEERHFSLGKTLLLYLLITSPAMIYYLSHGAAY